MRRGLQFSFYKRLVPLISVSIVASKGKQRQTYGQVEIDKQMKKWEWTELDRGRGGQTGKADQETKTEASRQGKKEAKGNMNR